MRKIKGFSYNPNKDNDVIMHIDKQGNGSKYVWELVRKDMRSQSIETIVKKYVEEYLRNIELPSKASKQIIDIDTEEIKNILKI